MQTCMEEEKHLSHGYEVKKKKGKKRWSHTISVESKNIYDLRNSHQTLTSKYLPTNSTFMEPKTQHRGLKDLNHSMGM